ncbi:MAG: hypothetical protein HY554_16595 [Elusimicrobia bacterium]|nr:hypothetical protein [Elusimicrobiota bacterium]
MRGVRLVVLAAVAGAAACGPDVAFERALSRERKGSHLAAAGRFERFARRYPDHPRVPEALVRAARIYAYAFQRCPQAQPLLEQAARSRPGGPWAREAERTLLDCPDYFPLRPGASWVFVDSQTGGKNMRLEVSAKEGPAPERASAAGPAAEVESVFYAGKRKFQTVRRRYEKADWAVWELEGRDRVPILRYPYQAGRAWSGRRGGKPVAFAIESAHERVQVKAGIFQDCLKVRESQPGLGAWKFDYFAPGVGRVKTTIGGRGFENPNTELASADVPLPRAVGAP